MTNFRLKLSLICIVIAVFVFMFSVSAATIFTDDFNSYNNGDLNGQGSWSGATEFDVQTGSADNPEGSGVGKEVLNSTNADKVITKIGTETANGTFVVYMKFSAVAGSPTARFGLRNGAGYVYVMQWEGATLKGMVNNGWVNHKTNMAANTWYCIKTEWRSSDNYWRIQVDSESWGDWQDNAYVDSAVPDRWYINKWNAGSVWFDYIIEEIIPSEDKIQMEVMIIG